MIVRIANPTRHGGDVELPLATWQALVTPLILRRRNDAVEKVQAMLVTDPGSHPRVTLAHDDVDIIRDLLRSDGL